MLGIGERTEAAGLVALDEGGEAVDLGAVAGEELDARGAARLPVQVDEHEGPLWVRETEPEEVLDAGLGERCGIHLFRYQTLHTIANDASLSEQAAALSSWALKTWKQLDAEPV